MIRFCARWIERGIILVSAFFAMQFPAFLQNYLAHLTGHLAELNSLIERFSHAAISVNKTLPEWIQKFRENSDPDIVMQGEILSSIIERRDALAKAEIDLTQASLVAKPFYFVETLDISIAKEAAADFHLSVPMSMEGGIYALAGAIFGWIIFRGIAIPFRISSKKKKIEEKEISR
jgi:hypothetical protein